MDRIAFPDRRDVMWTWLAPGLVAGVACAIGLLSFDTKPLWRDEIWTVATATRPWDALFRHLAVDDAGLAFYYSLMHLIVSFGAESWIIRIPSVIGYVCACVVTVLMAKRIAGHRAGVFAGLLLAVMPVMVDHSQEARPYSLTVLALCGSGWSLLSYCGSRSWLALSSWIGLAAMSALMHPLVGVPAVVALGLAAVVRPGVGSRVHIAAALLLPILVGLCLLIIGSQQARYTGGAGIRELVRTRHEFASSPVAVVLLAAALVLGCLALRRCRAILLILAFWAAVPILGLWIYGIFGSVFQARYTAGAAPGVAILAGVGLAWLSYRLTHRSVAALVITAVFIGTSLPGVLSSRFRPYYVDDGRSAVASLEGVVEPGDSVVYLGTTARSMFEYFRSSDVGAADVLLLQAAPAGNQLEGVEVADAAVAPLLGATARVWMFGTLDGDVWTPGYRPDRVEAVSAQVENGRELIRREDFGKVRVELWAPRSLIGGQ